MLVSSSRVSHVSQPEPGVKPGPAVPGQTCWSLYTVSGSRVSHVPQPEPGLKTGLAVPGQTRWSLYTVSGSRVDPVPQQCLRSSQAFVGPASDTSKRAKSADPA